MRNILAASATFVLCLHVSAAALGGTADEIMKKSQAAVLYPGTDFKARVIMKLIDKGGQVRMREMMMLRKNFGAPGGDQKFFMYFFQPADVRNMTFMVYKYPGKNADRWLFLPAINMVRRIAAQDKRSSFVGSDFTYEDISGRNLNDDTHSVLKEERIGTHDCTVVKSTPKTGEMEYSYKLSWIDKASSLPIKEEYFDKTGEVYKVFSADAIENVKSFPTITRRSMRTLTSGHRTEVAFVTVDYDVGIEDSLFTERYLKQPPRRWIE
jgi:hypothetical protein